MGINFIECMCAYGEWIEDSLVIPISLSSILYHIQTIFNGNNRMAILKSRMMDHGP